MEMAMPGGADMTKLRRGRPEVQPSSVTIPWNPRLCEHPEHYDAPMAVLEEKPQDRRRKP